MRGVALFCLLPGLLAVVPASAKDSRESEVREIASEYARCIIRKSASQARKYVLDLSERPPVNPECLILAGGGASTMRFPGYNYAYSLAEALTKVDYPILPPNLGSTPPLSRHELSPLDPAIVTNSTRQAAKERAAYEKAQVNLALDGMGECIVRKNPSDSYSLLRSEVGTISETALFERLKPAIAGCLPAAGTVGFKRNTLRGTIALNVYRLAHAAELPESNS